MKYRINKSHNGNFYLLDNELKLNSNCPASEKSGTGPGSCGGASKDGKIAIPKKSDKKIASSTYETAGFKHDKFDNSDNRIRKINEEVNNAFDIDVVDATASKMKEQSNKIAKEIDSLYKEISDLDYSRKGIDPARKEKIFVASVKIERLKRIKDKIDLFSQTSNLSDNQRSS